MKSIRGALIQTISNLTEEQALALVQALGQWADNTRNHVDESDPAEITPSETVQLEVAERFVEAGEAALCGLVEARSPLPSLDGWVTL